MRVAMGLSCRLRAPWYILSCASIPMRLTSGSSRALLSVASSMRQIETGSTLPELNSFQITNQPSSFETSVAEHEDVDLPLLPRNVQALYLRPLRREAEYGVPSCDLQLRSFSVRNLEFFADFALRAAYYLKLPAFGPVPLPRITQRWTVPKSHFVNKKAQENFERITVRRLIQIRDGHPETVELWLAFLKKHSYHGIGMKANIWEYNELGVGKTMDVSLENLKGIMDPRWAHFGRKRTSETAEKVMELMNSEKFRLASGGKPGY